MYHSIGGSDRLAVSPEAFDEQLGRLGEAMITFDDGYADLHEVALPLLKKHGRTATVFVTTGWLETPRMLSWSQLAELAAEGITIGGHSHSHPQLDQLPAAELRAELTRNKELLEDRLGLAVPTMAYPYGYSSARVRKAVRDAGYERAYAVANTLRGDDPYALPRLTVREGTSIERAVLGRGFLTDHALTKGYAVVRRSRYLTRRLRGVA